MRRDMDLVRDILMAVEDANGRVDGDTLAALADGDRVKALNHIEMMDAHGLVRASVTRVTGNDAMARFSVEGMTWEGYDYLDAMRSDMVWKAAKSAIAETVRDAPLSVVKDVCTALALHMVEERLGIS